MPLYDIDCKTCGAQTTVGSMNASRKMVDALSGRTIAHRMCACGEWTPQRFRSAPGGIVDGPADAKPFRVAGIDRVFNSHKQMEAYCKSANKDLLHTSGTSFKRKKERAKKGAETLASEMGYSSLGTYKEQMAQGHHAQERANQARERKGLKRD